METLAIFQVMRDLFSKGLPLHFLKDSIFAFNFK
jgi:hypothetical protein